MLSMRVRDLSSSRNSAQNIVAELANRLADSFTHAITPGCSIMQLSTLVVIGHACSSRFSFFNGWLTLDMLLPGILFIP